MSGSMDKYKDNGIILGQLNLLNLPQEVVQMARKDPELLNSVYKEISEKLGMDTAMDIYQLFKGQQVTFPMRFFNAECIRKIIVQEYDGTNVKKLAVKYGYSEKTIRHITSPQHFPELYDEWFFQSIRILQPVS